MQVIIGDKMHQPWHATGVVSIPWPQDRHPPLHDGWMDSLMTGCARIPHNLIPLCTHFPHIREEVHIKRWGMPAYWLWVRCFLVTCCRKDDKLQRLGKWKGLGKGKSRNRLLEQFMSLVTHSADFWVYLPSKKTKPKTTHQNWWQRAYGLDLLLWKSDWAYELVDLCLWSATHIPSWSKYR